MGCEDRMVGKYCTVGGDRLLGGNIIVVKVNQYEVFYKMQIFNWVSCN